MATESQILKTRLLLEEPDADVIADLLDLLSAAELERLDELLAEADTFISSGVYINAEGATIDPDNQRRVSRQLVATLIAYYDEDSGPYDVVIRRT